MGLSIKVDEYKATSVPNVFACGDAPRAAGNVTLALAYGAMAGLGRIGLRYFEAIVVLKGYMDSIQIWRFDSSHMLAKPVSSRRTLN
jgi:hypothetical protein